MRTLTTVACAILASGCFSSYALTAVSEDTSSTPDTPLDPATDTDASTDTIMPDTACMFEIEGSRQLVAPTDHETDAPRVYWTGSHVGVLMFESGGSIPHSYVSHTSAEPDLSANTPTMLVGEESHGWGEASWTGSRLGMCWYSDPAMVGRTAFRLLEADGSPVGPMVDIDFEGGSCVGIEYGNGNFLVAWRHEREVAGEWMVDSRVQMLDGTGHAVGDHTDLHEAIYPGLQADLIFTGDRFMVAQPQGDIVQLYDVDDSGELTHSLSIDWPGASYCDMALAGEVLGLACLSGERGLRGLRLVLIDVRGDLVADPLNVEQDGAGAAFPDLVAVPDGWALSWHRGSYPEPEHAFVLHLDEKGVPREPRIVVYNDRNSGYGGPSIAATSDLLFLGISHYPASSPLPWEQVHLYRLRCVPGAPDVCDPMDVHLLSTCDDPGPLGWFWNGAGCQLLMACPGDCEGDGCTRLAPALSDCELDHAHCST